MIDLRCKFGLPRADYDDQTCIIVVDVGTLMGIIVDTVREVYDISRGSIEPPPQLGGAVNTDFILGMGKVGDDVKILLDIEKVLTGGRARAGPAGGRGLTPTDRWAVTRGCCLVWSAPTPEAGGGPIADRNRAMSDDTTTASPPTSSSTSPPTAWPHTSISRTLMTCWE